MVIWIFLHSLVCIQQTFSFTLVFLPNTWASFRNPLADGNEINRSLNRFLVTKWQCSDKEIWLERLKNHLLHLLNPLWWTVKLAVDGVSIRQQVICSFKETDCMRVVTDLSFSFSENSLNWSPTPCLLILSTRQSSWPKSVVREWEVEWALFTCSLLVLPSKAALPNDNGHDVMMLKSVLMTDPSTGGFMNTVLLSSKPWDIQFRLWS